MKRVLFLGCFLFLCGLLEADELQKNLQPAPSPEQKVSGAKPLPKETSQSKTVPPRQVPKGESPSFTQTIPKDSLPSTGSMVSIVGLLFFSVALAIYFKMKRKGGAFKKTNGFPLEILQTSSVSGMQLSLIRLGNRVYFIGSNDKSIVCLDRLENSEENQELVSAKKTEGETSFRDEYSQMIGRMSQGTPYTQEPQPDDLGKRVVGELDELKRRLKELV